MERIIKNIQSTNEKSLKEIFSSKHATSYTFLNPVSYLEARKHKNLFIKYDGIFVDGSILSMAVRLLYNKKILRRSFDMTSVAPELFDFCIKERKTIYIIASKEDEIRKAVEIFRNNFSNLNIIEYHSGYFESTKEKEEEFDKVVDVNPDFLIIGMGVIAQEKFLNEVIAWGYKGIGFTCGGFISQTAKDMFQTNYYPKWIDRFNLRFLYRIYKEKHTRKRYAYAAFVFPFIFIKDRFFKS